MPLKVLVAGIGNIFKADDGFGVEVVQRLIRSEKLPSAELVDFGIRGLDLAYALLDGQYDAAILIDVVKRGKPPGTLCVLEIGPDTAGIGDSQEVLADTHGMHPAKVLDWVKAMGGVLRVLRLVGCEPEDVCEDEEDLKMGLTSYVEPAVNEAVDLVESLVGTLLIELEELSRLGSEARSCMR